MIIHLKKKSSLGWGRLLPLTLVFIILACSSARSRYASYKKKEGYKEQEQEEGFRVVTFRANAYTKKKDAELFAKFRAIELCKESGKRLADIQEVRDLSEKKDVVRTSGSGFPSYYYGMSPFYGRYGYGSGFGLGVSTMSSNSWEETYTYPEFRVLFACSDKAHGPEIVLRQVSPEDMKLLVKDLKGGLQVEAILEGSANSKILESGDVITKAQGVRIQSIAQLMARFQAGARETEVEVIREGERKRVIIKSSDVTSHIEDSQLEIIRSACRKKEIKSRPICQSST